MVRSRKRKATKQEDGRRDRSRVSARQRGAVHVTVSDKRAHDHIGTGYQNQSRSQPGFTNSEARVSNSYGKRFSSSERGGRG